MGNTKQRSWDPSRPLCACGKHPRIIKGYRPSGSARYAATCKPCLTHRRKTEGLRAHPTRLTQEERNRRIRVGLGVNVEAHRKHLKDICERCGFTPQHRCQMDVHHRDRNRKNNTESNCETLCANCHRMEHQLGH